MPLLAVSIDCFCNVKAQRRKESEFFDSGQIAFDDFSGWMHARTDNCKISIMMMAKCFKVGSIIIIHNIVLCMYLINIHAHLADPIISVVVNPNLNRGLKVGQTGTTLTCNVFGADNLNPTITYQWTKDNVTGAKSEAVTLSPLQLSHAGVYTCSVNVSSTFLNSVIQASANKIMELQSE